jgi:hypothetical protein
MWTGSAPRGRTRPAAYAWLAMLLGLLSLAGALAAPQQHGVQTGFIASSVGITAIVVGCHAVRVARWGSATVRAFGRGGALLGAVGTALMAYAVLAFALTSTGVVLPALSLPLDRPAIGTVTPRSPVGAAAAPAQPRAGTVGSAAPAPAADAARDQDDTAATAPAADGASAAAPAAAVPPAITSAAAERSAVTQSVGTLSFVMRQHFGAGPFPSALVVDTGSTPAIRLVDGTGLTSLPSGAQVAYSVAPDGSAWSVTVRGGQFGTTAHFDSNVGTVEVG